MYGEKGNAVVVPTCYCAAIAGFLPDWSWLDALSRGVLRFFGAQDQKIAAFGSYKRGTQPKGGA
ncbi:MAG: hypothetical protein ABS999_13570, partial [Pseudomonas atacamensis]|uniref:hypothetical protein n=1 Tax=Pseudomonas atacamensis TaxID=2565368 RepID=UPI0033156F5F